MKLSQAVLCASVSASIGPTRQKAVNYPHGCESCETSGEIFYSCPTSDIQAACIESWMNNMLPNGCYGNFGATECLAMGCVPNTGIHTFNETCSKNSPCPSGYTMQGNNGSISFDCPDSEAESYCQATFGPDFQLTMCLELGCILTDDSTYEEWCEGHGTGTAETGNGGTASGGTNTGNGCPSDCFLMHNQGSINFICPDQMTEDDCQSTFGPDFTIHHCLNLGCILSEESTYQEWCEGGSCGYPGGIGTGGTGTGGTGTGGTGTGESESGYCPSGCYLMQNQGFINFICPDAETEDKCVATFGPDFTLHECLHLGCHLSEDSTYQEWCEGGSCGYPGGTGTGTGSDGTASCPSGTYPANNGGSLWFDCPDPAVMDACRETFSSNDYSYMLATCISQGCVQSSDSTYHEWCEQNDWEPIPMCPEMTSYNLSGNIKWYCESQKSMQEMPLCIEYMDTGSVWAGTEQEAIHDCFYNFGCYPKNQNEISESCDFTGVPPTHPPITGLPTMTTMTTIPTITCPPNEIAVGCDSCREAFCCDSESWGCQSGMMKPALGCDIDFLKVCSGASCVCDVEKGYARAPNGSCVKGSACQQYFTATTEQPPVDDGLNAADCAGTVDYKFRSGKAKVSRSGENSNLVRLQQAKVKETKAHTGFVSFPKSACGKDFLAGLKDGRVTVDFADKKATYSVIGSYYVDNGSSTQVVVQYNSVPLNVADDKCPKCLGNSSTDQLEMLVMGTKNIEWGSKTAKACLNGALVGHAGAAGAPTLLENDESGCVAWTNAL